MQSDQHPTVERVAESVLEMLARPWPRDEAQLAEWLRWHHLEGATADASGPLLDWGDASGMLTFHRGCLAGVQLFLWSSQDPIELVERFLRLAQSFDLVCGEADDRWGPTGSPAASWHDATHAIEMYAHTGLGPCIQLAVGDAGLLDKLEAEARARNGAASHPLASLGVPADEESFATALVQTAELTRQDGIDDPPPDAAGRRP